MEHHAMQFYEIEKKPRECREMMKIKMKTKKDKVEDLDEDKYEGWGLKFRTVKF